MRRTTRSAAGIPEVALILLVVAGGACAMVWLPGFGLIVGPVLCLAPIVYLTLRRQQIWQCERCKEYFDPTVSSSTTRRGR
jgi:hypothetical protein